MIPDGASENAGIALGHQAAVNIITLRDGDGRMTPYGTSSPITTKTPAPGVWRLTPPAYLPPQIPWAAHVTPFLLERPDQFQPAPPPSLSSATWVADFNEIAASHRG